MGQFSQVYLLDREHPTCNIEFSKLATLTFKTSFGINTLATVARVVQTFVDIFASTCLTVKLEALNELFNLFKWPIRIFKGYGKYDEIFQNSNCSGNSS